MIIDFEKNKLVPAIVQDINTQQVLMLGYMDEASFLKTKQEGKVTFFSRSKNRLWTKGETSGNFLTVKQLYIDCDQDTILIMALPNGPTCHRNTVSCFDNDTPKGFIYQLQQIVNDKIDNDDEKSYTSSLYKSGINKVAQKVGEEAVELIIEAKDNNEELFKNEAADLLYHFLILLKAKKIKFEEIEAILKVRNK